MPLVPLRCATHVSLHLHNGVLTFFCFATLCLILLLVLVKFHVFVFECQIFIDNQNLIVYENLTFTFLVPRCDE